MTEKTTTQNPASWATPLFKLGNVSATQGVVSIWSASPDLMDSVLKGLISRHVTGDWGDLDTEDKELNRCGLSEENPGRLFSAYNIETRDEKYRVYCITEWDRSLTTILLSSEY